MPKTLLEALASAAATPRGLSFPGATPARLSYAEISVAAARMGSALAERYPAGRPVLIVLPNGPLAVTAFFAALHAGLVPSVLPLPRPFGDIARYLDGIARVSRRADDAPVLTSAPFTSLFTKEPRLVTLDASSLDRQPSPARPCDLALLQFTSGSLGEPKGVELTHDAVLGNGEAIALRLAATPEDVGCFWVPLAHDMGLIGSLVFLLSLGAEQVLMTTEQFAVDPGQWLRVAAAHGATLLSGPPFAFDLAARRLLKEAERGLAALPDLSRIRHCVVGAEPVDARVLRRVTSALGPMGFAAGGADPWVAAYGLAESACVVSAAVGLRSVRVRPANAPGQPVIEDAQGIEIVSCGRALAGTEVRLVDLLGAPVGERVAGRIEVRGRSAMRGYHGDPESTAAAFDEGWVRTGDVGFLDGGDVFVSGREKDVIIMRGRHFFPEEIEAIAREVPGVRTGGVVAFGVVDPSGGPEEVTVVVEAAPGDDVAAMEQRLRAHIADRLDLLVARVVATAPRTIPRTPSGKPRRGEARQRWGIAQGG